MGGCVTRTLLITGPFPELWRDAKSVVVIDGIGVDGKVFVDDQDTEVTLVKSPEILSKVTDEEFEAFKSVSESVFQDLAIELNQLHGTAYPLRYWRIVVGAWFQQFAQVLHMRLRVAEFVVENYQDIEITKLDLNWQELLPVTHDEASLLFATDIWNHHIYVEAVNFVTKSAASNTLISATERKQELLEYRQQVNFGLPNPQAKSKLESVLQKLSPNPKVVLAGVVQSKLALVVMHLRLRALPRLWRFSSKLSVHPIDQIRRQSLNVSNKSAVLFDGFLRSLITTNLPTIYLEGFNELQQKVSETQLRNHPKLIFSNTLLHRNEQFKVWSAEHVASGKTKLCSGQHGGGYGSRFYLGWNEIYEFSVVDKFLSWGWSSDSEVIVPTCVQSHQQDFKPNKTGGLLIVLGPVTRNSDIYGMLGVQSNSSYLNNIKLIISNLSSKVLDQTQVRPKNASSTNKPARVSGQQISEILGNGVEIDLGTLSLNETQSRNRISIVTYNETTIPTNILADFPTVAMWDPKYVRLTPAAAVIYDRLFETKILHYSAETVAQHVDEIWDDIDSWWQSPETTKARNLYCNYFARRKNFPALAVAKALTDYR
ncbi:MAG: hypothetical protein D4R92_00725 [Actinobacteria bacterium]|nr:MAG: hypothetical protein D4R92_00725 [Actinomycetota bacterium]